MLLGEMTHANMERNLPFWTRDELASGGSSYVFILHLFRLLASNLPTKHPLAYGSPFQFSLPLTQDPLPLLSLGTKVNVTSERKNIFII